jgi:disulfide bond formation protein DsbB
MSSTTNTAIQIVVILTIGTWVLTLLSLATLFSKKLQNFAMQKDFDQDLLLKIRSLILVVGTLGSLYFSEVAKFAPCKLCWGQRMFIFPLAAMSVIAIFNKTKTNFWIFIIAPILGGTISIYHILIERFPNLHGVTSCDVSAPCSTPPFTYWGFLTLACMALSIFIATIVLTLTSNKLKINNKLNK